MTAVIHHGPPGSYKTFSLVQRILVPALQAGRVVVTNIRGFNNLESVRSLGIDLPSSSAIYYLEPDTAGFDAMARFFHWAPAGALIVMDEGQRVYPTRKKSFDYLDQPDDILILDHEQKPLINPETGHGVHRPATLEIAFDQHRHYNWDIYISTPNIGKIHSEIRRVVEWAYRHRNNSGLLPWYKNTWTEFRHDAEQSGKALSHYSGTPKRYKADIKFFDVYQSTATGKAKNSTENISIFRDPKLRMLFGLIALCIIYVGYNMSAAFNRFQARIDPAPAISAAPPVDHSGQAGSVSVRDDTHRHNASHMPAPRGDLTDSPLYGLRLYYTGSVSDNILFFEAHHPDRSVTHITYRDLSRLGYRITGRSPAFISLEYRGHPVFAFTKPVVPGTFPAEHTGSPARDAITSTTPAIAGFF